MKPSLENVNLHDNPMERYTADLRYCVLVPESVNHNPVCRGGIRNEFELLSLN